MARVAVRPAARLSVGAVPQVELAGLGAQVSAAWLGLTFFLAAVAVSLYLVQVSSVATAGYELKRLEAERDAWLARNEQLQYELSKRRSLPWVEAQATQRLGLVRPAKPPIAIQVSPGSPSRAVRPSTTFNSAPDPQLPGRGGPAPLRESPGDPALVIRVLGDWISRLRWN